MAYYKSFTHVERLGKEETDGILNGVCYISPKLDGTNAVVWSEFGEVCAGSRTRKLSATSDNAEFYAWTQSNDEEAIKVRELVTGNAHIILYGEFGVGKVASIKDYDERACGKLWIFDMYDTIQQCYVHPDIVTTMCDSYGLREYRLPSLAIKNPSMEDIAAYAEDNKFLLSNANHPGEGVVIRNPDFRNKWGNYVIAKFVLDEFKERKRQSKPGIDSIRIDCEQNIVDYYVTEAELSKAKAKVCLALGLEEFDIKSGKCIGMYLNMVFNDAVLAEITDICKRYKRPVINFQELNNLCNIKAREYIGL
jgi:hypothetical protein